MTVEEEARRAIVDALRPEGLAMIGRNREAVERVIGRAVDDLGWSGAADLLRSVAARMEARAQVYTDRRAISLFFRREEPNPYTENNPAG